MEVILKQICKTYGKGKRKTEVLHNFSASFTGPGIFAIQGQSGCGKTTLLNVLGGLCFVDSGEYLADGRLLASNDMGRMLAYRRGQVGIIVQDFALIPDRTVFSNVELPLKNNKGLGRKEQEKIVMQVLSEFGMESKAERLPTELSGGEKQRTAIARAMVKQPGMLLADEPTGSLDPENANTVFRILRGIASKGTLVIMVTHDKELAAKCDSVLNLGTTKTNNG